METHRFKALDRWASHLFPRGSNTKSRCMEMRWMNSLMIVSSAWKWYPLLAAIVVYRIPWTWRSSKLVMKLAHAGLHLLAFVLVVIALVAVFDFHNSAKIPNMYSLHSWLGLAAVLLYALQVGRLWHSSWWGSVKDHSTFSYANIILTVTRAVTLLAFIQSTAATMGKMDFSFLFLFLFLLTGQLVLGIGMFLIPVTPVSWRAAFMPLHIYSGLFIFCSVIAVALMGITEKLIFGL